jgi:hypothetical protein
VFRKTMNFDVWQMVDPIKVGVGLSGTIASHKTLPLVVGMTMILDDFLRQCMLQKAIILLCLKSIKIYGRCLWINRNLLYHFSFYLYCVQTSNFATWSGLNFKTNVKVVLFKRENLIKTIWGALLSRWLSYCHYGQNRFLRL